MHLSILIKTKKIVNVYRLVINAARLATTDALVHAENLNLLGTSILLRSTGSHSAEQLTELLTSLEFITNEDN